MYQAWIHPARSHNDHRGDLINPEEIRITENEATVAAYGDYRGSAVNPVAMAKRRKVADAQLSKALWTIVDQLRIQGTLSLPSPDDLTAAAILEQIAILLLSPHPTTQKWFDQANSSRLYLQSADPFVSKEMEANQAMAAPVLN